MCKPAPKATAGAVLMNAICTKAGVATAGAAGSGIVLFAVAGTALNAWVIMALFGINALLLIALLVKHHNRPEPFAGAPTRMPAPTLSLAARRPAAIAAPRPAELTSGKPTISATVLR